MHSRADALLQMELLLTHTLFGLCSPSRMFRYFDAYGAVLRTAGVAGIAVHGAEHTIEGAPCVLGLNLYVT